MNGVSAYRKSVENLTNKINKLLPLTGLKNQPVQPENDSKTPDELSATYNERGHFRYLLVDFPEAIEDYTQSIRHKETAEAYYNRGTVLYRLGNFSEAVLDLEKALKLKPTFQDAQHCLEDTLKEIKEKSAVTDKDTNS